MSDLQTVWPTLAAFHAADPARATSREVVFGSEWYTARERLPWRASWIQSTGEFVVVHLTGRHEAEHGPASGVAGRDRHDRATGAWAAPLVGHVRLGAGSLPWLRPRLRELCPP